MLKPFLILASLLLLLPVMVSPAHSAIYIWTDATGVTNVTNDPKRVPSGVSVEIRSYDAPTPVTETLQRDVVTQGQFAVQLATELGLGEDLSPQAAADRLSDAHIAPRLSDWKLDAAMTHALLDRFRKLTVAAATVGRIPIGPEEARFAFDSATALAGILQQDTSIPHVPESTRRVAEEVPVPEHMAPPVVREHVIFVREEIIPVNHHPLIHLDPYLTHFDHGVSSSHPLHWHPIHRPHRHRAKAWFRLRHTHKRLHRQRHHRHHHGASLKHVIHSHLIHKHHRAKLSKPQLRAVKVIHEPPHAHRVRAATSRRCSRGFRGPRCARTGRRR